MIGLLLKKRIKIHLLIEIPFSNDDSTSVLFKRKVSETDPSPSKRQKIATNSETKTIYTKIYEPILPKPIESFLCSKCDDCVFTSEKDFKVVFS